MTHTDIDNITEPTFTELAQFADSLWDVGAFTAASRIYLQAAQQARQHRHAAEEATALHFAWQALQHARAAA